MIIDCRCKTESVEKRGSLLTEILSALNALVKPVLWGWPVLLLILFIGILYTVRLRCFQITGARLWLGYTLVGMFRKKRRDGSGITPFQSLSTALAGSIGTGNIVGVATAITLGGPGAVFRMWISALFGMMTIYGETVLGLLYRVKDRQGKWLGGTMVTLERGLGKKAPARLFAGACIMAALGMGNMTQANAISSSLQESLGIPVLWSGLFFAALLAVVLTGGIKRIAAEHAVLYCDAADIVDTAKSDAAHRGERRDKIQLICGGAFQYGGQLSADITA